MSTFTAVDLSKLPSPDVIEGIDYDSALAKATARFRREYPEFDAVLESDPVIKLLELIAYYIIHEVDKRNNAAKAVMLAYAVGNDLDHQAANYNVERLVIREANPNAIPPVEAVMEGDDRLRRRTQLAFEGLSTAGPRGAYIFHTLSASAMVADVSVSSPQPGDIVITLMSAASDGHADQNLIDTVFAALNDDDIRPLGDHLIVQAGGVVSYRVEAELEIYSGPDRNVVLEAARASVALFVHHQQKLGEPVTIDGLHKALRVEGVRRVNLISPEASVETTNAQYPLASAINVSGL